MTNTHLCNLELSVLLIKEGDDWVAQCLQYDIAAQGDTIDEAMEHWARSVAGHIMLDARAGRGPLEGIKPAPPEYWTRWERGRAVSGTKPVYIPSAPSSRDPRDLVASAPPAWMIRAMANEMRVF